MHACIHTYRHTCAVAEERVSGKSLTGAIKPYLCHTVCFCRTLVLHRIHTPPPPSAESAFSLTFKTHSFMLKNFSSECLYSWNHSVWLICLILLRWICTIFTADIFWEIFFNWWGICLFLSSSGHWQMNDRKTWREKKRLCMNVSWTDVDGRWLFGVTLSFAFLLQTQRIQLVSSAGYRGSCNGSPLNSTTTSLCDQYKIITCDLVDFLLNLNFKPLKSQPMATCCT